MNKYLVRTREVCRHCNGTDVYATKHVHRNETFHYLLRCFSCRKVYHGKRTKELFDQLQEIDWVTPEISKDVLKQIRKLY